MYSLSINTSKKYDVVIEDNFDNFNLLNKITENNKVLIVLDKNINKLYFNNLINKINCSIKYKFVISNGEKSKNFKNYLKLQKFLIDNNFKRNDVIIGFGGGVVGDLSGFVASTFCRGVKLIYIPTTLLSMVDSCIGGKNGINLKKTKNYCGTFYQPDFVYINTDFIKSLSKKELINGYGEIIKYSFIDNSLNLSDLNINSETIYNCLMIKKYYIEKDEFDKNERKILNFGHSFGHCIESLSNFKFNHGECVIKGMYYSLLLSIKYYKTDKKILDDYIARCNNLNIDYKCDIPFIKIINKLYTDKKCNNSGISLILLDSQLKPQITHLSFDIIKELYNENQL